MKEVTGPSRQWLPHEDLSWFGPLGFLVVLPALAFAAIRGKTRLRATAGVLAVYVVVTAWQVTWMPWNGRFFSLAFAGAAPAVAFLLQRWRRHAWTLRLLQCLAALILLYACAFNRQKPLIRHFYESWPRQLATESIWARSDWGRNRFYHANRYFGDQRVAEVSRLLPEDATVALLATRSWVYPFLLQRPDVRFVLFRPEHLEEEQALADKYAVRYLLCLEQACDKLPGTRSSTILWHRDPQKTSRLGKLYEADFRLRTHQFRSQPSEQ